MKKILDWLFPSNRYWLDEGSIEMLSDTVKTLIAVVGLMYYGWFFYVGARYPDKLYWQIWVLAAIVVAGSRSAWVMTKKNPLWGLGIWLFSLLVNNTAMILLLEIPGLNLLFAFVPLMAVFTINLQSGLLTAGLVAGILYGLSRLNLPFQAAPFIPPTLAASLALLVLGWAAGRSLREATSSSLRYYNLANQNLEEARQQQAKLFVTLKDLDMAYYRLNQAHAALGHALKRAENAERLKAELVTFVSHEMRTPLNLIAGFSEMILTSPESYGDEKLPGAYRGDINKIYRNARHLLELCDDIIDLSRANMGKIPLVREKSDLRVLVLETANMVRDFIASKGLELRIEIPDKLPELLIDRLRIRQVLLNLLVNAARFTEKGGIVIHIEQNESRLTIKVTDSGRGIPQDDLPAIFEGYYSTGKSGTTWHSGSGLGLPISKKLVELHGGSMGVSSAVDQGTTFWFTLPLSDGDTPTTPPLTELRSSPMLQKSQDVSCVLVHDDPRLAALLQRHLPGYHILPATNLNEGIQLADEFSAGAIISNLSAPMNLPKDDLVWIECPLPDRRSLADKLGVLDILYKPVSAHELFTSIDRLERPPKHILIVDDDYETVELFHRFLLKRLPLERSEQAYDGIQAMDSMRRIRPDLVLLDLSMPRMDGYQVLEQMQGDARLKDIPVIIISGHLQDEENLNLQGSLRLYRPSGYQMGEISQIVHTALNTLAIVRSSPAAEKVDNR